jgi:hypothetical protein
MGAPYRRNSVDQKLSAILHLKVINRSNHQSNIKNGFLDPKNPIYHVLINTVGHIISKLSFFWADGSHFEFGLSQIQPALLRGTPSLNFFINLYRT